MNRPDPKSKTATQDFYAYQYLRENPPGELRELWFHEQGDRSWLVVTRNISTHDIINVELARDVALQRLKESR